MNKTARSFTIRNPRLHLIVRIAAILLGLLLTLSPAVRAQSESEFPNYWQYATSGRLLDALAADIDRDGVDEFLVFDENFHLELISASGKPLWSYVSPREVTALGIVNVSNVDGNVPAIVLGLSNQLILLSDKGETMWNIAIKPLDIQSNPSGVAEPDSESAAAEADQSVPLAIKPLKRYGAAEEEILVLLTTGELLAFDQKGNRTWRYADYLTAENAAAVPQLVVADFDSDQDDEIVLSVFHPRRFGQVIFIDNGQVLWDLSLSRSVTDLEAVEFGDGDQPLIAISTTSGHVQIYDQLRRQHWLRTLNRPITEMVEVDLPSGTVLAVGTDSGRVAAFDEKGERVWDTVLSEEPGQSVLALSAAPVNVSDRDAALAVTLKDPGENNTASTVLLDGRGIPAGRLSDVDNRSFTQFIDSNHDLKNELLVSRFATLELLGLGAGNMEMVREWDYSLNAAPGASLVTDLDGDGIAEMIVGTLDGRVHSLSKERNINWLHDTGGAIQHIATMKHHDDDGISLVVAGNSQDDSGEPGWVQLRDARGERLWDYETSSAISAMAVADVLHGDDEEIILGTDSGTLILLSNLGEFLAEMVVLPSGQAVKNVAFLNSRTYPLGEIVVAGLNDLMALDASDWTLPPRHIASFAREIGKLYAVDQPDGADTGVRLLLATKDGLLHGLDSAGNELTSLEWPVALGSEITALALAGTSQEGNQTLEDKVLLASTRNGKLLGITFQDGRPSIAWELVGQGEITDIDWYDQTSDGSPDVAVVGNQDGLIELYYLQEEGEPRRIGTPLDINSAVFDIASLERQSRPIPNLMVVGNNGLIQLFRDQENRSPLLTEPIAQSQRGQYSISVNVLDVEGDDVAVTLEMLDPETGAWLADEEQHLPEGNGTLFWALPSPVTSPDGLHYRLSYTEGTHSGILTPTPGPAVEAASPLANLMPLAISGLIMLGLALAIVYYRQFQSPDRQAARVYEQMREHPSDTLSLFEAQLRGNGQVDLTPYIASQA
ncbi:MAG: PQQ-binding-like beta-propeller repeat protein, partial [Candidatus Promineifilaceae bacterium]